MKTEKLIRLLMILLLLLFLISGLFSCAGDNNGTDSSLTDANAASTLSPGGSESTQTASDTTDAAATSESLTIAPVTVPVTEPVTVTVTDRTEPVTVPSTEPVTAPVTDLSTEITSTPVTETTLTTTAATKTAATATEKVITATRSTTGVTLRTTAPSTVVPPATVPPAKKLTVSELCIKNQSGVTANDGERYPWVELCALSDVELSGYSLSFDDGEPIPLPEKKLSAGELYLFFITKDDPALIKDGGKLALLNGDGVIEKFGWVNIFPDRSFVTNPGHECDTPTPGAENCKHSSPLVISEMMADNTKFPIDGALPDYIELYNASDRDINLSDYYISDKPSKPLKTGLPERTLKPGEYILLVCGTDLDFNLSKNGESVSISTAGREVIYSLAFTELDKNEAITPEGISTLPSPGYKNGKEGYEAYICSRTGLVISEVLPSNTSAYAVDKEYYDIIELYNASGSAIELSDYFLTDKMSEPERWRLPKGTLAPGAYKIIVFDGKGSSPPFSLGSDGETVKITRSDGYISDVLTFPALPTDISYGKSGASLLYFDKPTLGKANGSGYAKMTASPVASIDSGFYSGTISVKLYGDGDIYYNVDGRRPTKSSKKYAGGNIVISKNSSLRAICYNDGELQSFDITYNYFVDYPDLTLPIVKVTVENSDMYGSSGIYTNYNSKKEVEAHVAMYIDGNEEFSVNCGLKVFGAYSRRFEKKSYQLKFRAKYGCARLKYDIFGDGEVTEFNSLVLRSGSQDYYRAMMRDEFAASMIRDYMEEVLVQNYRPVSLFINDQYIGVYYIREKINDDFVAAHYGVSPESVTIINKMAGTETGSSGAEWRDLWKFIKNNDLTIQKNYDYVAQRISLDSVIDYYIVLAWSDNRDCGNVRVFKSTENDGKWRFIYFDVDLGFGLYKQGENKSTAKFLFGTYNPDGPQYNALIYKLLKNETFKDRFLQRLNSLIKVAFNNDVVLGKIDLFQSTIDNDMKYHPPWEGKPSYKRWIETYVAQLRRYVTDRDQVMIKEFTELLKLTKAEQQFYFEQ